MSSRREFLIAAGAGISAAALGIKGFGETQSGTTAADFSKWRGFFLGSFGPGRQGYITRGPSLEDDFRILTDWGFNAVRLRIDYTQWVDYTDKTPQDTPYAKDLLNLKESFLVQIDDAINLGLKYKVHVLLCMFHAPGYDVRDAAGGRNDYTGPYNLWTDKVAQDAFAFYWGMFAKRYAGIAADALAFDLVNEPVQSNFHMGARSDQFVSYPTGCTHDSYTRVVTMAVSKIREASPDRPIFAEGLSKMVTSDEVVPELIPLKIGQTIHGYAPPELTHFGTGADSNNPFPVPTWPAKRMDGSVFGPDQLAEFYKPFGDLTKQGIPVLCGEFGVSSRTPNDVAMRYTADILDVFKTYGVGWMYLNLRGAPGPHGEWTAILDSTRRDVPFEFYHDHSLNRQMLTLLQNH